MQRALLMLKYWVVKWQHWITYWYFPPKKSTFTMWHSKEWDWYEEAGIGTKEKNELYSWKDTSDWFNILKVLCFSHYKMKICWNDSMKIAWWNLIFAHNWGCIFYNSLFSYLNSWMTWAKLVLFGLKRRCFMTSSAQYISLVIYKR